MRHESERVPGKNFRPFAGRPLYHHIVGTLSSCPLVGEIVIDTDSPIIEDDARQMFPHVHLLKRPEHLRSGNIPMNEVLLNDVRQIDADVYLQTHSTNPLLREETISRGIALYLKNRTIFDSLFSVTRIQTRLWNNRTEPINHDPSILLRTQDLAPLYEENSCLYLFERKTIEQRRTRIGERPLMFEIEQREAWDIDEESDFVIGEFLYEKYCFQKGRRE